MTTGRNITTRVWIGFLHPNDKEILGLREVEFPDIKVRRGAEDVRLLWRDGGWMFTAVLFDPPYFPVSRLAEFSYDPETNQAHMIRILETDTPSRFEKNWMPPQEASEKFDYVYSTTQVYKDGKVIGEPEGAEYKHIAHGKQQTALHGGTQLVAVPGGYLGVMHDVIFTSRTVHSAKHFGFITKKTRSYRHYFVKFNEEGFMTSASEPFIFRKAGIEFASGMVQDGDDLLISFGIADIASGIARIPVKEALKLVP